MATSITWSENASADLEAIVAYIARDSPHHALAVADRLIATVEKLARFPRIGRIVPEFDDPKLRQIVWRGYRVIYRVEDVGVTVVTVIHGARRIRKRPG